MKLAYGIDEHYPVIALDEDAPGIEADVIEVPESLLSRYQAALTEWRTVQTELNKITIPDGQCRQCQEPGLDSSTEVCPVCRCGSPLFRGPGW
jgi:hypothetical protein